MAKRTQVDGTNGTSEVARTRAARRATRSTDRWWQRAIERSAEQLCSQATRLLAVLLLGLAVLYSVHRTGQMPTTAMVEAVARAAGGR